MKKLLVLFLLAIPPTMAQENLDTLFNNKNPNIVYNNEAKDFSTEPLVYIDGVSDKPQPKNWFDKLKVEKFGSMDLPKKKDLSPLTNTPSIAVAPEKEQGITIKPWFGPTRQVAFIPHTSQLSFIIQQNDSNHLSIQENIQFITTQEKTTLLRKWPIENEKLDLILAQLDGVNITKQYHDYRLEFIDLAPGLHELNVIYDVTVLPNTDIPLWDGGWDLTIDRMDGIILLGQNKWTNPTFLLGKNKQEIPENFIIQRDKQNNIIFQNTYVLPQNTQIMIHKNDIQSLHPQTLPENSGLLGLYLGIIIGYLCLSLLEVQFMNDAQLFKKFHQISENRWKNWWHRMHELIIGCILLWGLIYLTEYLFQTTISIKCWGVLIILPILLLIIIDQILLKKQKNYSINERK